MGFSSIYTVIYIMKQINTVEEFPDYLKDMGEATGFSNNAVKLNFLSRFFKTSICGVPVEQLSLKKYIILSENDHVIFNENFTFEDCIKFIYELQDYKYFKNVSLVKAYRYISIGKRVIKYLRKKYGKDCDAEAKLAESVKLYFETICDNLPNRYVFSMGDGEEGNHHVEKRQNDYYIQRILSFMAKHYGWSENEMLNMPVQVFFGYYHILLNDLNPEYVRETKADATHKRYSVLLAKIKNLKN